MGIYFISFDERIGRLVRPKRAAKANDSVIHQGAPRACGGAEPAQGLHIHCHREIASLLDARGIVKELEYVPLGGMTSAQHMHQWYCIGKHGSTIKVQCARPGER